MPDAEDEAVLKQWTVILYGEDFPACSHNENLKACNNSFLLHMISWNVQIEQTQWK
jgi:hypothetical protein